MKPVITLFLIFLLCVFGYISIKVEIHGYTIGLLGEFNYLPISLVLILTVLLGILAYKQFKVNKKIQHYLPTAIGLIILLFVGYKIFFREFIDGKPTILSVSNMPHANNVIQFEFKGNHYFRFVEYSMLGHTIYYGRYEKNGDRIVITSTNYDGVIDNFPKEGVIKGDTLYWSNFDTMLIDKK